MKILLARCISIICLLRFRLFYPNVKIGRNVIANWKLKISGPGQVVIGDGANLWAFAEPNQLLTYSREARIEIGANTRINGATLQARQSIVIGVNCLLGSTIVMDNDFHHPDPQLRDDKNQVPTKPVIIGDNVWLAGQSAVLKGVTISDGAVVGFRAVVTKDIPTNARAVGNPARILS